MCSARLRPPRTAIPPITLATTSTALRRRHCWPACPVKDGRLVLPDGMSYRVLVLPERDTMTPTLLQKVKELVEAGATVIGPRPIKSPSLSGYPKCDEAVKTIAGELWGDCDGATIKEHAMGKGRIVWESRPQANVQQEAENPWRKRHGFGIRKQPPESTHRPARVASAARSCWMQAPPSSRPVRS